MGSIGGVLPGQTVKIIVQAVNEDRQGLASDPIVFTVPLPVQTTAAEPKATFPIPRLDDVVVSNGNGGGSNGHANGNRIPEPLAADRAIA